VVIPVGQSGEDRCRLSGSGPERRPGGHAGQPDAQQRFV